MSEHLAFFLLLFLSAFVVLSTTIPWVEGRKAGLREELFSSEDTERIDGCC